MFELTAESKTRKWTAPEIPLAVEYDTSVMEEIRVAVAKAAKRETGGVLFGTRQDDAVRIATWRPIHCEHANGPAFDLSSDDRRVLLRLLLAARSDPELAGLQPVGWFVSHLDGDLALRNKDVVLGNDFFSLPWQLTLALAPLSGGAARARFFARDAEGHLQTDSSAPDFAIEPLSEPKFKWHWPNLDESLPWAIAGFLAIVLTGVLLARRPAAPPVVAGFALRIEDAGPAFEIDWNAGSEVFRDGRRAELEIRDGSQLSKIALDAAQLRQGTLRRQRGSNDVQVRMRVGQAEEYARLIVKTVSAPAPPAAPSPDPLEGEVKRLNQELHQERAVSDRLKQTVKILENTIAVDKARKASSPERQ